MNPAKKNELTESVLQIIEKTDAMDALEVLAIIQGNSVIKARVKDHLISFCQQQLS